MASFWGSLSAWGSSKGSDQDSDPYELADGVLALTYEETAKSWNSSRHGTLSADYRAFLQSAAKSVSQVRNHDGSLLVINLSNRWEDRQVYTAFNLSVVEPPGILYESPPGLALLPLDALFLCCAQMHRHLAASRSNRVIIHARTCSSTAKNLATFLTTCHLIYSADYDTAIDAASKVMKPPLLKHEQGLLEFGHDPFRSREDTAVRRQYRELLPGQFRYCEYLTALLHHPSMLPASSGEPIFLSTVYCLGLSAFGRSTRQLDEEEEDPTNINDLSSTIQETKEEEDKTPSGIDKEGNTHLADEPEQQQGALFSMRHPLTWVQASRTLMAVYNRGVEVWSGGATIEESDDEYDYDEEEREDVERATENSEATSIAPATTRTIKDGEELSSEPADNATNNNNNNNSPDEAISPMSHSGATTPTPTTTNQKQQLTSQRKKRKKAGLSSSSRREQKVSFEVNVPLAGDVVIAFWFTDHRAPGDPPALAYAFHTAFVSITPGQPLKVLAKHLDVPGTSSSYADLAAKENFQMDLMVSETLPEEVNISEGLASTARVDGLRDAWNRIIEQFGLLQRASGKRSVLKQLRTLTDGMSAEKPSSSSNYHVRGDDDYDYDYDYEYDEDERMARSLRDEYSYSPASSSLLRGPSETLADTHDDDNGAAGIRVKERRNMSLDQLTVSRSLDRIGDADYLHRTGTEDDEEVESPIKQQHVLAVGTIPSPPPPLQTGVDSTPPAPSTSVLCDAACQTDPVPEAELPSLVRGLSSGQLSSKKTAATNLSFAAAGIGLGVGGSEAAAKDLSSEFDSCAVDKKQQQQQEGVFPSASASGSVASTPGVSPETKKKAAAPPPPPPPLPPGSATKTPSSASLSPSPTTTPSNKAVPPPPPPLPPSSSGGGGGSGGKAPPPPPPLPPGSGKKAPPPPPPPPGSGKKAPPPPPLPPGSGKKAAPGAPPPPPPPPPGRGGSTASAVAAAASTSSAHTTPVQLRLRAFYWSKSQRGQGTVWQDIAPVEPLKEPYSSTLEELFAVRASASKENTPGSGGGASSRRPAPPGVKLIPLARANNISIMLTQFSDFKGGAQEIKTAVLAGDARLGLEHLSLLMQLAPSNDEIKAFKLYKGPLQELSPPEQFLSVMTEIPRLVDKVGALIFRRQFTGLCSDAAGGISTLRRAVKEVQRSERWRQLLAAVLAAGNKLNAGTHRGNAEAVRLESLLKMADVKVTIDVAALAASANGTQHGKGAQHAKHGLRDNKAPDGGTVRKASNGVIVEEKEKEEQKEEGEEKKKALPVLRSLLEFVAWNMYSEASHALSAEQLERAVKLGYLQEELASLADAVRRMQSDVMEALKSLDAGMATVKRELEAETASPSSITPSAAENTTPLSQRQAQFEQNLQAAAGTNDINSDGKPFINGGADSKDGLSSSAFAQVLAEFLQGAEVQQDQLRKESSNAELEVSYLVNWLGEPPEPDASPLFQLLLRFVVDFDHAFRQVHRLAAAATARSEALARRLSSSVSLRSPSSSSLLEVGGAKSGSVGEGTSVGGSSEVSPAKGIIHMQR